ncbi:mannosyltransferase putative-domain-containing protein [Linnemannia elongata]|nr:mannosyltransferase putative-domain-containing protein [Linnemannia elongata]
MHSIKRSPILKLVAAVAVNFGFVLICQQYWRVAGDDNGAATRGTAGTGVGSMPEQVLVQQHVNQQQQQNPLNQQYAAVVDETPLRTFEVPEELYLTHDVAIPYDIPVWTAADSAALRTAMGYDMMSDLLKPEYSVHEIVTEKSQLDFARTSRAERVYKSLFNFLRPVYDSLPGEDSREKERVFVKELAPKRADVDFFLRLEKRLYPFLHLKHRTSFSLQDSYRGKGFVLCAGNNQFKFIVSSIQAIRRLQPDLPIQLFHMGDGDLSRERQEYVREMTNDIEVLDITEFLDNDYMKLGGWSIKAFSLLASRFEEAMLVDSDAYFLQDPAKLFEDPGYRATGSLFFYDRTLFPDWHSGPDWIRSMMPIMSTLPNQLRSFKGISTHEQESGVVVINKKTRLNGLLAICKMNSKWERDLHSYKVFYGDKETFWVGFEMVQEPYSFMRTYGGVVGELRDDPVKEIEKLEARLEQEGDGRSEVERQMDRDEIERQKKRPVLEKESVCGAQLHLDYLGQPMWWNGGLMRNKNEGVQRTLDFKYWMAGGGMSLHRERNVRDKELQRELLWDLGKASMDEVEKDEEEGGEEEKDPEWIFYESCMYGGSVHLLEEEKKKLTESFVEMDRVGKEDEAKIWGGKGVDPKEHDWASM